MFKLKFWKVFRDKRARREARRTREIEVRQPLDSEFEGELEARSWQERNQWEQVYVKEEIGHGIADSGLGSSLRSVPTQASSVRNPTPDAIGAIDGRGTSSTTASLPPLVTVRRASDAVSHGRTESPDSLLDLYRNLPTYSQTSLTPTLADSKIFTPDHVYTTPQRNIREEAASPLFADSSRIALRDLDQQVNAATLPTSNHVQQIRAPFENDAQISWQDQVSTLGVQMLGSTDCASGDVSPIDATIDEHEEAKATFARQLSMSFQLGSSTDVGNSTEVKAEALHEVGASEATVSSDTDSETSQDCGPEPPPKDESYKPLHLTLSADRDTGVELRRDNTHARTGCRPGLKDWLPGRLSRDASNQDTKGRAKSAANAGEPGTRSIPKRGSPGIRVDRTFAVEWTNAASSDASTPSENLHHGRTISNVTSRNSFRHDRLDASNQSRAGEWTDGVPLQPQQRSMSSQRISRQNQKRLSVLSTRASIADLRSQPLMESPIEADFDHLGQPRGSEQLSVSPHELSRHTDILRKPTTGSAKLHTIKTISTPNLRLSPLSESVSSDSSSPASNSDAASVSSRRRLFLAQNDNQTLTQRKHLVKQQRPEPSHDLLLHPSHIPTTQYTSRPSRPLGTSYPPHSHHRLNSSVSTSSLKTSLTAPQVRQPASLHPIVLPPKQPRRPLSTSNLHQYHHQRHQHHRTNSSNPPPPPQHHFPRIPAFMDEGQYKYWQDRQAKAESEHKRGVIDLAMRSGALNGAHREAMRRMQAEANRKAS